MKQLVTRMAKKAKPRKKRPKSGLSQKERFIAYAREVGADETGETFKRAIKKLVRKKQSTD